MPWRIRSIRSQSGGRRISAPGAVGFRLRSAGVSAAEALERRQLLANTWYVSTLGSDSNPGTLSAPFQTIQHAANLAEPGDTVLIRGGIYHESVTPAHPGAGGAPITYAAYNNESVTIDGADPIGTFSGSASTVYQASMGWDLGEGNNQIFVDGQPQTEARWPNIGADPSRPNVATAQNASVNGTAVTIFDSAITQAPNFWAGATIHFTPGQQWVAYTATVTASGTGWVSFTYAASSPAAAVSSGTTYYLVGKLAAIDSPGEWYYDPTTQLLSLDPSTGDNPNNHLVEAKHRQAGFNLAGIWQTTIRGINFFACTINTDGNSWNDTFDHISMQYVSQYLVQPDGWQEPYVCGLLINGSYDLVENSTIAYSSGDGIFVTGNDDRVTNNVIHDVALNAGDAAGVRNYGFFNSVDHNTIYNTGRSGILAFGGYSQYVYNTVYNFMLQTTDGAGIYTHSSDGTGSEIGYNRIHAGHSGGFGVGGIYLDNDSHDWLVDHNITWDVDYSIKLNNSSRNERIFDNTFDATQFSVGMGGAGLDWTGTLLLDNIFTHAIGNGETGGTFGVNLYSNVNADLAADQTLLPGSPAIDAGQVNPPYTNGYVGAAPDLGALEFGLTPFVTGAAIDWVPVPPLFKLNSPASPPPPPPPVVPPPPPPPPPGGPLATSQINALSYTAQQGIYPYAGAIAYFDTGDWVEYAGVNFGAGVSQFHIDVALAPGYQGRQIQLRIDGVSGTVIGSLTTQATSGWGDFQVQSTAVADVTGVHDLYLVGAGGGAAIANWNWFDFDPASTTPSAAATFIRNDTTTSGNWSNLYGSDGFWTIGGTPALPGYATAAVSGAQFFQWAGPGVFDTRAPQIAFGSSTRVAACYYSSGSFTIDLNLTDGKTHQVALYLLDADWQGRGETVTVANATTGALLASSDVRNFGNGDYLVYSMSGHVTITIANDPGIVNAVISGIYFGPTG